MQFLQGKKFLLHFLRNETIIIILINETHGSGGEEVRVGDTFIFIPDGWPLLVGSLLRLAELT